MGAEGDHFSSPTNFPTLPPLSTMNFEDVEERDGAVLAIS